VQELTAIDIKGGADLTDYKRCVLWRLKYQASICHGTLYFNKYLISLGKGEGSTIVKIFPRAADSPVTHFSSNFNCYEEKDPNSKCALPWPAYICLICLTLEVAIRKYNLLTHTFY